MKRDPRLRDLSSEHHQALVIARAAGQTAAAGDAAAAAKMHGELRVRFERELEPHFAIEEWFLLPAMKRAGLGELVRRTLEDHRALRSLMGAPPEDAAGALGDFGARLTEHVRFEERTLFPAAEEKLTDAALDAVARQSALAIRRETSADTGAIRALNLRAFDSEAEAAIVDRLRAAGALALSLVAEDDGAIIGHIAFSPVAIDPACDRSVAGLAPMAVLPEHQRTGVGERLVREGLAILATEGWDAVVVLGHPGYYPRFGFRPASTCDLRWEHDCPDEAFMALELSPGALSDCAGVVRYRPELAG